VHGSIGNNLQAIRGRCGAYAFLWVLALALRGIFLWQIRNADVFGLLMGDAESYDAWAQEIAGGNWLGTGVFFQAPLYPYFIGAIYTLFGRSLLALTLVQVAIGATSCVLLARAGRSFFPGNTGFLAGLLLAIYPVAIFFDCSIQKTVLDSFFVCALLAVAGGLRERAGGRRWAAAGVVLGLLALTRENALIFLPVLLIWLFVAWRSEPWIKRFRWSGLLLAGLVAVLLPVALRNQIVGGEFHLTTSQFGPNFFIGNNRNAGGFYGPLVWDHGSAKFERNDATLLAEQATGRALSPGEVSRYWTTRTFAEIGEDPGRWLGLLGRKWLLFWNVNEAGDTDDPNTYGEWSSLLRTLMRVLNFGTICPLAVLGACLTWPRRGELWPLYAMVLGYAASVTAFYIFSRYRFPIVPVLLLFASAGLTHARAAVRARAARTFAGAAAASVTALVCHYPLIAENEMSGLMHYNIAVRLAAQRGDTRRALAHYQESVRRNPDFAIARFNLAVLLKEQGRAKEAVTEFRQALRLRPDYPEAENNLGAALFGEGQIEEAFSHINTAVQLNPYYADAHYNLALLLAARGKTDEALMHLQAAARLDPSSEKFRSALERVQPAAPRADVP
jgi:tetratricopeptide (TPR) repeat protein